MTPAHPPHAARSRPSGWWLLLLVLPVVAVVGSLVADVHQPPPVPDVAVDVPAGYRAVSDIYFGFAVPHRYALNAAYSDSAGDSFYGTDRAWVGQSERPRSTPPAPGEAPPHTSLAFGVPAPVPYQQSSAGSATVPGADVSYRYQLTRPGGFEAVAIDTWLRASQTELWLIVAAPPDVTNQIIGSLRA